MRAVQRGYHLCIILKAGVGGGRVSIHPTITEQIFNRVAERADRMEGSTNLKARFRNVAQLVHLGNRHPLCRHHLFQGVLKLLLTMKISLYHVADNMEQLRTSNEDIYALTIQWSVLDWVGRSNGGRGRDQILFTTVVMRAPVGGRPKLRFSN